MPAQRAYQQWDQQHPRSGEAALLVRGPDGEVEFGTDDPVEFLGWLGENYPFIFKSIRLELATYQLADDRN